MRYNKWGYKRKYIRGHGKNKSREEAISNIKIDENGCWIWQRYKTKLGYGQVGYKGKVYSAHRFSYETYKGSAKGFYVCHKCDNPPCINPEHLYLGTPHDNVKDIVFRYRNPVLNFIHSDEKVIKIRELFDTGNYKQIELAKMFDVDGSLVSRWVRYEKRPYAGCEINPNVLGGD